LEDEVKEEKKENVRERQRKSRAKKKVLALKVRVGTQPPQIKEEPVSVWLDDDNGDVLMPDVNEDNHNHDNNDTGDGSSTTSPPSIIKPVSAVRLQSPTRPSHHHTPGLITPELFSSLSSFATSTPGPSHVSSTPGPLQSTSRSRSNSSRYSYKMFLLIYTIKSNSRRTKQRVPAGLLSFFFLQSNPQLNKGTPLF
jgi:hypothetical protein